MGEPLEGYITKLSGDVKVALARAEAAEARVKELEAQVKELQQIYALAAQGMNQSCKDADKAEASKAALIREVRAWNRTQLIEKYDLESILATHEGER